MVAIKRWVSSGVREANAVTSDWVDVAVVAVGPCTAWVGTGGSG